MLEHALLLFLHYTYLHQSHTALLCFKKSLLSREITKKSALCVLLSCFQDDSRQSVINANIALIVFFCRDEQQRHFVTATHFLASAEARGHFAMNSSNETLNGTGAFPHLLPPRPTDAVIAASASFVTLVMLLTILGNGLVCYSVFRFRRLRSPTNYLIVSLAVSDILVGVLSLPFRLTQTLHGEVWPDNLGLPGCKLWIWVDMLGAAASILNLTGISIDRLIAISQPLKYRERMTGRRVLYIIAFVWAYAIFCSSLSFVKWNNKETILSIPQCSIRAKEYITIAAFTVFFCPLVILVICYGLVLKIAVGHAKKVQKDKNAIALNYHLDTNGSDLGPDNNDSHLKVPLNKDDLSHKSPRRPSLLTVFLKHQDKANKNKRIRSSTLQVIKQLKATKTLAIVVGFFILCWFPFFVIFLTSQYCETCFAHMNKTLLEALIIVFIKVLPVSNSAANPIIYSCFNVDFRLAFVVVFNTILCRKERRKNPYYEHTQTNFSSVWTKCSSKQTSCCYWYPNKTGIGQNLQQLCERGLLGHSDFVAPISCAVSISQEMTSTWSTKMYLTVVQPTLKNQRKNKTTEKTKMADYAGNTMLIYL